MPRECVVCGDVDSEGTPLLELPCFNHWVCEEDIATFFENATSNESLFPPQCCDEPVLLDHFAEHVPEDVQLAFRFKEQGEYTILPKYRVYCADSECGKFLHPSGHIKDAESNVTYAVCDGDNCFQATCCACKALLKDGIPGHVCTTADHDQRFKEVVEERGYKECNVCGMTVELAEACNHITCECGSQFCYICGKDWNGVHGCPQYGPAHYDAEGYNQDGFHRDTDLNRHGRTRREQVIHDLGLHQAQQIGEVGFDDGEGDEAAEQRREHMFEQVLSHLDPDRQAMLQHMHPDIVEDALTQFQIALIEQGVVFDATGFQAQPQQHHHADEEGEQDDEVRVDSEQNGHDDEHDEDSNDELDSEVLFEDNWSDTGSNAVPALDGWVGDPAVFETPAIWSEGHDADEEEDEDQDEDE